MECDDYGLRHTFEGSLFTILFISYKFIKKELTFNESSKSIKLHRNDI